TLCSFFICCVYLRGLHSFPTRRSSDLLPSKTLSTSSGSASSVSSTPTSEPPMRLPTALPPACPEKPMPTFTLSHRSLSSSRAERSEEHTSELQSRENLVCRLLLEKKKT